MPKGARRKETREFQAYYSKYKIPKEDAKLMLGHGVCSGYRVETKKTEAGENSYEITTFPETGGVALERVYEQIVIASLAIGAVPDTRSVYYVSLDSPPTFVRSFTRFVDIKIVNEVTEDDWKSPEKNKPRPLQMLILKHPSKHKELMAKALEYQCPVIGLLNVEESPSYTDIAIRCNVVSPQSMAVVWWLFTREVCRLTGVINRNIDFQSRATLDDFGSNETSVSPVSLKQRGYSNLGYDDQTDDSQRTESANRSEGDRSEYDNVAKSDFRDYDSDQELGAVGGARPEIDDRSDSPKPPVFPRSSLSSGAKRSLMKNFSNYSLTPSQGSPSSMPRPPSYSDIDQSQTSSTSSRISDREDGYIGLPARSPGKMTSKESCSSSSSLSAASKGARASSSSRGTTRPPPPYGMVLSNDPRDIVQGPFYQMSEAEKRLYGNQDLSEDHQFLPGPPGSERNSPSSRWGASGRSISQSPGSSKSQEPEPRYVDWPISKKPPMHPRTPKQKSSESSPRQQASSLDIQSPSTSKVRRSVSSPMMDSPPNFPAPGVPTNISPRSTCSQAYSTTKDSSFGHSPSSSAASMSSLPPSTRRSPRQVPHPPSPVRPPARTPTPEVPIHRPPPLPPKTSSDRPLPAAPKSLSHRSMTSDQDGDYAYIWEAEECPPQPKERPTPTKRLSKEKAKKCLDSQCCSHECSNLQCCPHKCSNRQCCPHECCNPQLSTKDFSSRQCCSHECSSREQSEDKEDIQRTSSMKGKKGKKKRR